jgi:tight adherence protein B
MPRPEPWMLALLVALSAALAMFVVFQAFVALREWRIRREALESLGRVDRAGKDPHPTASVFRQGAEVEDDVLQALGERIPQLWDLHHALSQSGLRWTLGGLGVRSLGSAALGAVVGLALSGPALSLVAALFAGSAPYFYVRWRRTRRILQLESQLPDAIDLLARAVRAGHPLSEGLRMAAEEAQDPLASEFRITFEEQKFGLPFEEALLGLGDRVEIVDMRILVTAILVQREVGGNLSEILDQISETMRERFTLKRQVRVYTAQGRMSGYTLAALPVLVGFAISVINPSYMTTLFRESVGQALLAGAVFLQGIGFLWIRRIVDVRY